MSTPRPGLSEDLDEKATLRARVVELERENDLLKQAQPAHTGAGGGLPTSGTQGAPELESLQHIYRAAPIGLCCLDTNLRYVFVNEWLAAINGLSVEQHLGRSISEVLPDVAAGVEAQLRGVIETGEPVVGGTVEAETAAEPGVKKYFEHQYDAVKSADGDIVGVSCVVQDISARKQAEEALRLIVKGTSWAFGEDFFRSLTRHLALALEVRIAFVSELHEGSESRLRLVANWEGHDFGENFEYDVEGTPCELVIEKGLAYYPANVQQLFPDDRWLKESRIESYLAVSLLDLEGNPLGHLGVADDKPMPKSRLAESILRIFAARAGAELLGKRAEALLRHTQFAVEHSSDSIYWVRSDGRITYANRAACRALGYSYDELLSMSVPDINPDFPHEAWQAQFEKMKKAGSMTFETHDRTKEGRIVPVEILSNYLDFEGEEYVCAYVRDITERKRAQEQARQLQADLAHMSRLSTMGEMATGLAHELNQPLTVITNYAQGCVRRLESNSIGREELGEILGRIATQARRSGSIIRGLANLVRKSSAQQLEIDINHCIEGVADLANAEATQHGAKARFELEPNLPPVMADQTQLQQVILNLVQNGCEAVQDAPESRRAVTVRTKQRGDRELEISVSDNGCGIVESLAERMFEPFFTTKAQGIGMGLAISRSIVEAHGGRLWATPNRGEGTTFHFTLPILGGHDGDE